MDKQKFYYDYITKFGNKLQLLEYYYSGDKESFHECASDMIYEYCN